MSGVARGSFVVSGVARGSFVVSGVARGSFVVSGVARGSFTGRYVFCLLLLPTVPQLDTFRLTNTG